MQYANQREATIRKHELYLIRRIHIRAKGASPVKDYNKNVITEAQKCNFDLHISVFLS